MSIETVLRFAQLGLSAPVLQAIDEVGYETPSPIQARCIPAMLAGRDVLGQAQTGTGKTAAFALPILCRVDPRRRDTQALVLTPTRELAIQVAEAVHSYARHIDGLHVLPVYGGQHIGAQFRPLQRGVHVVVGTPGRIIDHLERGTLRLDAVRTVVLDEADEMLRMGFVEDVDRILDRTPAEKQVALYSATMPPEVRRIAERHLRDPETITIEAATATVASVRQQALVVPWRQKLDVMTRILESTDYDAMLIFVRTKTATLELSERLEARGHACTPLNGDMTQNLRERAVQRLREGSLDILVATDVAARGLDVPRISHVVNYDIPNDVEAYIHRIGRTGRAGREGEAILLVQPRERRMLRALERATGQPIERMELPTSATVLERRVALFKAAVRETMETEDLAFFDEVVTDLAAEIGDGDDRAFARIAAALACLAQVERPLRPDWDDEALDEPWGDRSHGHDDDARRDERRPPRRAARIEIPADVGMTTYRVEVGHRHGVQPRHLVGAITNETGLEGRHIGRITVHDAHSTVDLPDGLPKPMLRHLQQVDVLGHPLLLSVPRVERAARRSDHDDRDDRRDDRPRRDARSSSREPAEAPRRPRGDADGPRTKRAGGERPTHTTPARPGGARPSKPGTASAPSRGDRPGKPFASKAAPARGAKTAKPGKSAKGTKGAKGGKVAKGAKGGKGTKGGKGATGRGKPSSRAWRN